MLKKKFLTAYRLFREYGLVFALDHAWLMLQCAVKRHRTMVILDGCRFSLDGISPGISRINLLAGRFEKPERRSVTRYLRRDLPVVELGGSIGVVACVTNKLLKNPTAHLVVEANPQVLPHLQQNKEANGCKFEITNRAIAYGIDSITLHPTSDICGSSVLAAGDQPPVTIETARLGDLVRERGFTNFTLICDIEGQEYEMVQHEQDILKNASMIILETHARMIGEDKVRSMMDRLRALGFRLIDQNEFVVVLQQ
jgi:FkbM family methyltransferase